MHNKALLLASANKQPKPHMVVTVDEQLTSSGYTLRGFFGATLGDGPTPAWKDSSTGNSHYISSLVDWDDGKYVGIYIRTELMLEGPPLALAFDSIQITRVDTAETFVLTLDQRRMEFSGVLTSRLFHDTNTGDPVGLIFDPPPDKYF